MTPETDNPISRNLKGTLAGFAGVTAFLVFLPALYNGFAEIDDAAYVVDNPNIRYFGSSFYRWAFFDSHAANWHPLTWMSHALDYSVWGLNPAGHHLTNIIIHALNTSLVALLVVRLLVLLKERAVNSPVTKLLTSRAIMIAAGTTGLLFGVHPLHVESVSWIAERKDLLCGQFFLSSILLYTNYAGTKFPETHLIHWYSRVFHKQYLAALGLFTLALLSKPMAVSLPVVLLILDWYPLGRIQTIKSLGTVVIEKAPFFVLSLVSAVITILAQEAGGAMKLMATVPLSARLLVAFDSLVAYLLKSLWPYPLLPFYSYPEDVRLFSLQYITSLVVVAGISAFCIAAARKQKVYLSLWLYFIATLLPVLGIIQVGEQSMADRYTYLPGIAFFLLLGTGAAWLSEKFQKGAVAAFIAGIFIVTALIFTTVNQTKLWKNGITLWSYFLEKEPTTAPFAYHLRGRAFEKAGELEKAAADYSAAISLNPSFAEAYNSLGTLYGKTGRYENSIEIFSKSILLKPTHALYYNNRGRSYYHIGFYSRALEDLNKAIELNQHFDLAYMNRAETHIKFGNMVLAGLDLEKACGLGNTAACTGSLTASKTENKGL